MERIASFTVDHTVLTPGLYLSRRDGDAVTLDLRFKKPNTGDLLTNAEMHSVEHLIATLLRSAPEKDAVLYFGPMGCQTGFYALLLGVETEEFLPILQATFEDILNATEVPAANEVQCGWGANHSLSAAQEAVREFLAHRDEWLVVTQDDAASC